MKSEKMAHLIDDKGLRIAPERREHALEDVHGDHGYDAPWVELP